MKRLALMLAALPLPALAHPGDHSQAGLFHLLTEPDHLAMAALVAVAVLVAVRYAVRR